MTHPTPFTPAEFRERIAAIVLGPICDANCPVCWPEGDPHRCVFTDAHDGTGECYQCGEPREAHQ